jgi:hypothetical protein
MKLPEAVVPTVPMLHIQKRRESNRIHEILPIKENTCTWFATKQFRTLNYIAFMSAWSGLDKFAV